MSKIQNSRSANNSNVSNVVPQEKLLMAAVSVYFYENEISVIERFFNDLKILHPENEIESLTNECLDEFIVWFKAIEKIVNPFNPENYNTVMDYGIKNKINLTMGETMKISRRVRNICECENIKFGNLNNNNKVVYPNKVIERVIKSYFEKN